MTDYTVVKAPSGFQVEVRPDCDCSICRAERGLKPLSDRELTAKREAKR